MKPYPEGFPHFETEEELHQLILEALDSDDEGTVMTPEEWQRLREDLGVFSAVENLAS